MVPQEKTDYPYVSLDEEGGALYAYTAPKGVDPEIYGATEGNAVLLTGTLRSGQTVEIKGNAVLLGDVNAGAYLMGDRQYCRHGRVTRFSTCRYLG